MLTDCGIKEPQGRLLQFLCDGSAYGSPAAEVETITTHAAVIFLVGERAFKMKRVVRYSFLDFTRLAARKAALEAELRLNRRTAPMLYRHLIPVTDEGQGRLALGGPGEPLEWLLEMRRFDQDALLDRVAERGSMDAALIDRLAREIATFHDQAEIQKDHGGLAGMRQVIEGDAEDFSRLVGEVLPGAQVVELDRKVRAEFERQAGLLEHRRRKGKVRLCHGDLHLGNIVLLNGAPVLFDCLEFDEALASIDTLYDLAFLVMDLVHRRLDHLAQRLLTSYLDVTWDDEGTALLPLFLSCRAAIRSKVVGFGAQSEDQPEARAHAVQAAREYLERALGFLSPPPPRLIAIGGVSGTGKSTLAAALAPEIGAAPGAVVLRSDVVRKKLFGKAPEEQLGPAAYSRELTRKVYRKLTARAAMLLRAGHSAIVDAVLLAPEERAALERLAREAGVVFQGFWLSGPVGILERRIADRRGDASDADAKIMRRQLGTDPGPITWPRLDTAGSPETILAAARRTLAAVALPTGARHQSPSL
jgi:hypothetical protein